MIQRIQSLYLLIIILISVLSIIFLNLWMQSDALEIRVLSLFQSDNWMFKTLSILYFLSPVLALISLLNFKSRKRQLVLNNINVLANLFLLGFLVFFLFNLSGEVVVSEKGIGSFLPLASIVLLLLANRAIRKDENLVKSIDRIR